MRIRLARVQSDSGQVAVFVLLILTALIGMAALVIDVGSWYHADRKLQTSADAGALAGAQELPSSPSAAIDRAREYATNRNGSGLNTLVIDPQTRSASGTQQDTIHVAGTATAPGFFARVISSVFNNVTVRAEAEAQVQTPSLEGVAPIGVPEPRACTVASCFGQPVTMAFTENDQPDGTKFGLLNLASGEDPNAKNPDTSQMGDWIRAGYAGSLPVETDYTVGKGDKNGLKNAIDAALGRTLLFPVFDPARSIDKFYVIGWAAFVIDERVQWNGSGHVLKGHFVTFRREDLHFNDGTPGGTYFGVPLVIRLIK